MIDQKSDSVSDNELECPYCEEQIDSFELHINGGFKNGETFSCNNCDLVISNQQCISSHKQIVHTDAMKVFSCETCNIDFTSKKYLFTHKDIDHQQQNVGKKQNGGHTEDFVVKVEIKEEEKDDTLFENISNSYEVTQSFKQEYKCDQCQKSFAQGSTLKRHINFVHEKLKKYKCEQCSKPFSLRQTLKFHVDVVHEKLKKFKCDQCPRSFGHMGNLKSHLDCVHRQLKKFKCNQCSNAYGQSHRLKIHIVKVHAQTTLNSKQ